MKKHRKTPFQAWLYATGEAAAAELCGVTGNTVKSWRLGLRSPRPRKARLITQVTPLTLVDIYGDPQ